jgi:hypothetical protein
MIDVDQRIREEVDRLLRLPDGFAPDWRDVVARGGTRRARGIRRKPFLLAVALAAAVAVVATSPLGGAIARTLGDFSAWIAGDPGTPASPAEQQAFQRANERSWVGFPPDTKLRRLIRTNVGGTEFTLYGFRSGDSLCLRLLASGIERAALNCAPLHELQTSAKPALVVAADEPMGASNVAAGSDAFMASFGIVSDGVKGIEIHADDGEHEALVAGNAFLFIADHPKLGTRVRSIEAIARDGDRVVLGFASSPYGMLDLAAPPTGSFHGPSQIERRVSGGTIGWLERLEPRGDDVTPSALAQIDGMLAHRPPMNGAKPPHRLMARALHPDPGSPVRLVLVAASPSTSMRDPASLVCQFQVVGETIGGGCSRVGEIFTRGPLSVGMGGSGPSQYTHIAGLASDEVAKIRLYLGNGRIVDAPLQDNAYSTEIARSEFPLRIAAYDAAGRVIGLESFENDGMSSPAPAEARKSVRQLMTLTGPNGGSLVLEAGDIVGGYRCWQISARPNGGEGGGCTPWPVKGPTLGFISDQAPKGDHFLAGELPAGVASVEISYPDGTSETAKTPDEFLVHLVPADKLIADRIVIVLRAYDAAGKQLAQRGLRVNRE